MRYLHTQQPTATNTQQHQQQPSDPPLGPRSAPSHAAQRRPESPAGSAAATLRLPLRPKHARKEVASVTQRARGAAAGSWWVATWCGLARCLIPVFRRRYCAACAQTSAACKAPLAARATRPVRGRTHTHKCSSSSTGRHARSTTPACAPNPVQHQPPWNATRHVSQQGTMLW